MIRNDPAAISMYTRKELVRLQSSMEKKLGILRHLHTFAMFSQIASQFTALFEKLCFARLSMEKSPPSYVMCRAGVLFRLG